MRCLQVTKILPELNFPKYDLMLEQTRVTLAEQFITIYWL